MDYRTQKAYSTAQLSRTFRAFTTYNAKALKNIIRFCIMGIRPLLGPAACRYQVSCGIYALEQLNQKPLLRALWAISKRLVSCNPLLPL